MKASVSIRFASWAGALAVLLLGASVPAAAQEREEGASCGGPAACFDQGVDEALAFFETESPRALSRAVGLLSVGCTGGLGDSCYLAGRLLLADAEADSTANRRAAELFERGCRAREPSGDACASLGEAYAHGLGREVAPDSAIHFYERACDRGNPSGCIRAGELYALEMHELGPQRLERERALAERACAGGSPNGCRRAGVLLDRELSAATPGEYGPEYGTLAELVRSRYRQACEAGDLMGCNNIGTLFGRGELGVPLAPDSAWWYYEIACTGRGLGRSGPAAEVGEGYACNNQGDHLVESARPDTVGAIEFYRRACLLLDTDSCVDLARTRARASAGENAYENLLLVATACFEGSGYGCNNVGWQYEYTFEDTAQAREFYALACQLGEGNGCNNRGVLAQNKLGDEAGALKYYRRACDLGNHYGCRNLGDLLATMIGEGPQVTHFYARACAAGDGEGCWRAMLGYRAAGDRVQEGIMLTRACRASRSYCKVKT